MVVSLRPPRWEGRIAIVTAREVGCDGRGGSQRGNAPTNEAVAYGEIVGAWHPDADAKPRLC